MVKELLLGDNPFIGVSHLAHEKSRETLKELTIDRKIEVIEAAVKAGATGFTFSTHPENMQLLKYMSRYRSYLLNKLNYYILVPYAAGYVREATKTGVPRLVKKIFVTSLNKYIISAMMPPTPANFVKIFLETEIREYMKILPRSNVKAVLLHEVLTELIAAFNIPNLVEVLAKHFYEKDIGFGLETRNIVCTKKFLEENGLKVGYIMTPINPLGYQMTPSKESAESAILELSDRGNKIIAVNVLASGAVSSIEEALFYLRRFKDKIYAVAIGTSKPQRAVTTFSLMHSLITE